jgi:hypothetical protein
MGFFNVWPRSRFQVKFRVTVNVIVSIRIRTI